MVESLIMMGIHDVFNGSNLVASLSESIGNSLWAYMEMEGLA